MSRGFPQTCAGTYPSLQRTTGLAFGHPSRAEFERYDLYRVCVFILPGQKADACTCGSFTGKAVDAARQETDRYFVWTSH